VSWTCSCGTVLSDRTFECEFCNSISAWLEEENPPLYDINEESDLREYNMKIKENIKE